LTLSQGSMSVMEYESRFSELEKFAPHICVNDAMRASKFVYGLKGSIRGKIVGQDPQTMATAVRAACLLEIEQARYQEEKKTSQKTYSASTSSQDRKRKQQSSSAVPPAQRQATAQVVPRYPVCPKCGKNHGGECFMASGKCFNCGEV